MTQKADQALVAKVFSARSGYTPAKGDEVELSGVLEVNKPTSAASKKILGEVVAIPPGTGVGKCTVELRGSKVRTLTAGGAITAGQHVKRNSTGQKVLALVVGNAPAAEVTGTAQGKNGITWTPVLTGEAAGLVTVELRDPGSKGASLVVQRKGFHIDIQLATDQNPAITSTAELVRAAVVADSEASRLVVPTLTSGNDGSAAVAAAKVYFDASADDSLLADVGIALETASQDGDEIEVLER